MKCGLRLSIASSLLIILLLLFLKRYVEDIFEQYDAAAYLADSLKPDNQDGASQPADALGRLGDKVIVMAKLEEENTNWVQEELPDWQRAIYTVNPTRSSLEDPNVLTTPINKGHESMAYLTYIIENYSSLPATVAFLHPHRSGFFRAWHVDAPLHDSVTAMQALQLDFVQRNGYVNLRCNWNPGCKKAHRKNKHVSEKVWREIFMGTTTPPLSQTGLIMDGKHPSSTRSEVGAQLQLGVPKEVGAACCAQFAVSRDQILKRPVEDYIHFRRWVMETDRDDATSGRILEFLWHVIFGKEAVYCPDEDVCYCEVFGRC